MRCLFKVKKEKQMPNLKDTYIIEFVYLKNLYANIFLSGKIG